MSFLRTVATLSPSRSIAIVSRTRSLRSWILSSSCPSRSSNLSVWRTRSFLPFTLNARSPASFSIQKSSPIDSIFSRIL